MKNGVKNIQAKAYNGAHKYGSWFFGGIEATTISFWDFLTFSFYYLVLAFLEKRLIL
jgi:hypothetical protein